MKFVKSMISVAAGFAIGCIYGCAVHTLSEAKISKRLIDRMIDIVHVCASAAATHPAFRSWD